MPEDSAARLPEAPARSYLFVPADRPERFSKALAAGADAVIVDLEDGVAPGGKSAAREQLRDWLSPEHPVCVRINAAGTEDFRHDLELCRNPGVSAIVVPKAEKVSALAEVAVSSPEKKIVPIIETARGFANVAALACQAGVQRLFFGSLDLQFDLGINGSGVELLYFRSHLVLASRLAGLQAPVEGVTIDIRNLDLVEKEAHAARRLGFGGKACIHPNQVAAVNMAFTPTQDEIAWAQRVIVAWQNAAGGVALVDGRMVDRPVARKAESILLAVRRS